MISNSKKLPFLSPDNIPIIWSHVQQSGTSQIAIGELNLYFFTF